MPLRLTGELNARNLTLGEIVYLTIIYHISYSLITDLLNGYDFKFRSHDWLKPKLHIFALTGGFLFITSKDLITQGFYIYPPSFNVLTKIFLDLLLSETSRFIIFDLNTCSFTTLECRHRAAFTFLCDGTWFYLRHDKFCFTVLD